MTMSDPHSDGSMSRALDIFGGSSFVSGESASRDEFFDDHTTLKDCNSVSFFLNSGVRAGH
jgi:16S rRNA G966 N2-methylase RsmD